MLVLFTACTNDNGPVVTVCETDSSQTDCSEAQTDFSVGQRLSVYLEVPEPLGTRQIIGKIKRVTETDTLPLGAQPISVAPEQQSFTQTLPFHDFGPQAAGTFLIEFVDDTDRLIANKEITIR